MKARRKRRTVVIALVAAVLLAGAGAAIAYWTTTGSGTGTATAGTGVPVTVTQDSTITGLFPGGPNVAIDFTINNPAPGPQFVTAVAIAVTGTSNGGCTAADFQVTQPTITAANIPIGATSYLGASTGAAIRMIDTGVNQNACKGVTVNLSYTVS
jgi:hypothetical protein